MTGSLDERVARLERRVRRWKALSVAAALVGVASLLSVALGFETPDAIVARSFFLVDEDGHTLAKLMRSTTGGPVLILDAVQAGGTVAVGSFGPDAGVSVVGKDGTIATLAIGENGGPMVSLSDKSRKAWLALGDKGSPNVFLQDASGHLVAAPSRIELKDASGKELYRAGLKRTDGNKTPEAPHPVVP